ncbi:MAG TPA: PEP-CTERM sorting domain-containing protein [Terriglobia bacterium]
MTKPESEVPEAISKQTTHAEGGLERRLLGYAVAATAGVGFLSGQVAKASIVVTPVNTTLTNGTITIDFSPGVTEFKVVDQDITKSCCFYTQILRVSGNGKAGAAVVGGNGEAEPLAAGRPIAAGDPFQNVQNFPAQMATAFNDSNSFFFVFGPFANTTDRFLGLRFEISGQTHYGWAEFSFVRAGFSGSIPYVTAHMVAYAYDTVPNQGLLAGQDPSAAPEPGTLGLMALGFMGLRFWRKKKVD